MSRGHYQVVRVLSDVITLLEGDHHYTGSELLGRLYAARSFVIAESLDEFDATPEPVDGDDYDRMDDDGGPTT